MSLDEAALDELIRSRGLKADAQPEVAAPPPPFDASNVVPPSAITGKELPVDIPGRRGEPTERPRISIPAPPARNDDTDLARARSAISSIESGDRYDIVHPKARNGDNALGRYGVMSENLPEWSRQFIGREVSRQEFLKSPDIQDRIFEGKFGEYTRKYGLEGAARAWFAGEGGMNNPRASDGNVTVDQYASKFMAALGRDAPAGHTGSARGPMSQEDMDTFISKRGLRSSTTAALLESEGGGASGMLGDMWEGVKEAGRAYTQYEAGVLKGAAHVPLGIAQAASDMTGGWLAPIEDRVRQLENTLDEQTGGRNTWADFAGRMVGSTAAIMLGARALGPVAGPLAARLLPSVAQKAWQLIGAVGRGAAIGAPLGATLYYPEGTVREERFGLEGLVPVRAIDAALGSTFGAMGGIIARGVTWAANNLSKTTATARQRASEEALEAADIALLEQGEKLAQQFNDVLQNTARGMTRNSEGPLRNTIANYASMERIGREKYGLRNVAGQRFEGFRSGVGDFEDGFKQALDDAVSKSPLAGVEQKAAAQTAERRVRAQLGLTDEEGRLAEWQGKQRLYNEQEQAYRQAIETHPLRGAFEQNPRLLTELGAAGQLPTRPVPPDPFVPKPVSAAQYLQARTTLNATYKRTKDAALKTQLGQMLTALDDVARGTADEYGLSATEFTRLAAQADRFYEQKIAPLRYGLFKGRTAAELEGRPGVPLSGMTPMEFYELVYRETSQFRDLAKVKDFAKILGPESRSDMAGLIASNAILLSDKGARTYVRDRREVLTELLGKQEYRQLEGLANIAEHIQGYKPFKANETPAEKKQRTLVEMMMRQGGHAGGVLGVYQAGRGALGIGDRREHFMQAGLFFAAVPLAHFAYGLVQKAHQLPVLRPMVRRAATMEPGSVELSDFIQSLERRIRSRTALGGRAVGEGLAGTAP